MALADRNTYLADIVSVMKTLWPNNRTINIVCHGHSVPSGYFETPMVDTFNAYPHLLHQALKVRHPFAVINVIVTAIGGENSESGAARFEEQVLCHRPDILTIDYALNDRGLGLERARKAWQSMIEKSLSMGVKVILLTPTPDLTQTPGAPREKRNELREHAGQVCELAGEYEVGLVDSLAAFDKYVEDDGELRDLLSQSNHPNRLGHEIVARELMRWFPVT